MRKFIVGLALAILLISPFAVDTSAHTGWHYAVESKCEYNKVLVRDAYMVRVYDNSYLGYHHEFRYYSTWRKTGGICWYLYP